MVRIISERPLAGGAPSVTERVLLERVRMAPTEQTLRRMAPHAVQDAVVPFEEEHVEEVYGDGPEKATDWLERHHTYRHVGLAGTTNR